MTDAFASREKNAVSTAPAIGCRPKRDRAPPKELEKSQEMSKTLAAACAQKMMLGKASQWEMSVHFPRKGRPTMKSDPGVIDYLNKALRHELTAVNQYWLHYRLLDNWGYRKLAKKWRKESIEEMQHADRIIVRIIFLEGFPHMQPLETLNIGQTVKEVIERDMEAEMDARALYTEASTYCHSVADYVSRGLFEELTHDEEEHIDFLETQLDLIGRLGLDLYAQHHIGELSED